MNRWNFLLLLLTAQVHFLSGYCHGHERKPIPLTAAVSQADAIAVVRIIQTSSADRPEPATADVQVERILKGQVSDETIRVRVPAVRDQPPTTLVQGERYILFLRATSAAARYQAMADGSMPASEVAATLIEAYAALLPPWSDPTDGLSCIMVPEELRLRPGEDINLWAGFRNVTDTTITLEYREWPLGRNTMWVLDIDSNTSGIVRPIDHPHITSADIESHFSTAADSFDVSLAPGQTYFFVIDRINSAKAGNGYKQRLNFKYYPVNRRGEYVVTAVGYNIRGDTIVQTSSFRIWID